MINLSKNEIENVTGGLSLGAAFLCYDMFTYYSEIFA